MTIRSPGCTERGSGSRSIVSAISGTYSGMVRGSRAAICDPLSSLVQDSFAATSPPLFPSLSMILEEIAENLSPVNPKELPNGNCAGRDLAMSAETGVDNGEAEANDVTCDHQALSSSAVTSRPTWYLLVLVLPLEP